MRRTKRNPYRGFRERPSHFVLQECVHRMEDQIVDEPVHQIEELFFGESHEITDHFRARSLDSGGNVLR